MNVETLEALKGSIAKWEAIADGKIGDEGNRNCPLCLMFDSTAGSDCEGCPVASKTGESDCGGTPYWKWYSLQEPDTHGERFYGGGKFAVTDKAKAAALAERDFLKSLLPTEQVP